MSVNWFLFLQSERTQDKLMLSDRSFVFALIIKRDMEEKKETLKSEPQNICSTIQDAAELPTTNTSMLIPHIQFYYKR